METTGIEPATSWLQTRPKTQKNLNATTCFMETYGIRPRRLLFLGFLISSGDFEGSGTVCLHMQRLMRRGRIPSEVRSGTDQRIMIPEDDHRTLRE
jgi:hypothetical protein